MFKLKIVWSRVVVTVSTLAMASLVAAPLAQADTNWTLSGSNVYNTNSGNVGIGTTAPGQKLEVDGGFLVQGSGSGGGSLNGYSYANAITFDHTKDGSSDTSNFVALFSTTTMASLATVSHGGDIQNTVNQSGGSYTSTIPADLIFTSDSGCATKLAGWEFENYSTSTGATNVWINVGTLTHASDLVIYMCYGNSSVTTQQATVSNTWPSSYGAVYHFPNGSTLSLKDSTSNANNGTATSSPAAATGQTDGGASFNASDPDWINLGTSSSLDVGSSNWTVSVWAKWTASGTNEMPFIQSGNFSYAYGLTGSYDDSTKLAAVYGANSTYVNWEYNVGSTAYNDGNWHYLVAVGDASATPTIYVDGTAQTNGGTTSGYNTSYTSIGQNNPSNYSGNLDEVRVSNVGRSASQILAEYNNQWSPNTFYTVGAQQTSGGGGSATPLLYVNSSGNVGINTTTPSQALDIQGNLTLTGNILSDGDICIGTCP